MKSFFKNIFLWVNVLFALILALCALVPYLNPNLAWPIVFIGLGFLGWLIINILFIIYHLLGLNKAALISIIAILLNLANLKAYFGTFSKSDVVLNDKPTLKIATLNTQLFGYFEDPKTKNLNWERDVVDAINEERPDVLCMQEFLSLNDFDLDYYKKKMGYKYASFKPLKDGRKKGIFGIVIFSKYPILASGGMEFSQYTGNMGNWIEIMLNQERIKIFNIHLQSIKFSRSDYKIIEKPKDEIELEESKTLLRRVKNAALTRADQVKILKQEVKASKIPVIVCGDFNEPPVSYAYGQLNSLLKDAYTQTEFGLETTYTGKFPAFRIDHILHDNKWHTVSYKAKVVPSDHKLVIAEIKI